MEEKMTKHHKSGRLRRRSIDSNRKRKLLAATSLLATSLGVAAGELADGTMRVANAEKVGADHIVHKHIAGTKYEDVTSKKGVGVRPPATGVNKQPTSGGTKILPTTTTAPSALTSPSLLGGSSAAGSAATAGSKAKLPTSGGTTTK
jgi:hypothetical protein